MRIILADHQATTLQALKVLLNQDPEFDLVGEAEDTQGLLALSDQVKADLILFDNGLPGDPIGGVITRLHALKPRPIIVVMSREWDCSNALLAAGADAFVSKGDEPDWLLDKLHRYAKQINREGG
jgi:two-component system response regulator FimZ (fimbrial Z protein)/two-component system response regulator EvgA